MKSFFKAFKDSINDFIKNETNGPDAKINLIFGLIVAVFTFTVWFPSGVEFILGIFVDTNEVRQSSSERMIIAAFMIIYFMWCVKRLGKINDEKNKQKLKKTKK